MGIFDGKIKISRYLLFTIGTYAALSFFTSPISQNLVQHMDKKQNIEKKLAPQDLHPPNTNIEQKLKEKQNPEPPSKYDWRWQEEIRRNYRTELV